MIINLQQSLLHNGLSKTLLDNIRQKVDNDEQVLIFINKLGYAKALVCKDCGDVVECEKCDRPYTLHLKPQYLNCHFCGTKKPIITHCQKCNSSNLFSYGFGTEKIEEALLDKFSDKRIIRFDRENIKNNNDLEQALNCIANKEVDIIIGTQMIAKGHHFDNITTVGVLNIDAGFYSTDINAVEQTAQLIIQVSGRAGRGEKKGTVFIQTFQSENKTLKDLLSKDYLKFLDILLVNREVLNYPPFMSQALVVVESLNEVTAKNILQELYLYLKKLKTSVSLSGVLPALHTKKNNVFTYYIIISDRSKIIINKSLRLIKMFIDNNYFQTDIKKYRIYFDIDPIEF